MAIQLKLYWGKLDLKSRDYQSHHKVIGESRMSIFHLTTLLVVEAHHHHVKYGTFGRIVETFSFRLNHRNLKIQ